MGTVILNAAVSLDGFIADESGGVGPLFDYDQNGDVPITLGDPERVFHVTAPTAEYLRRFATDRLACSVIGRTLFDLIKGWNGRPATGEAIFVVTHEPPTDWPYPDAPFTFVTDGGCRRHCPGQGTGNRHIAVSTGNVGGQAIRAGLVDEVHLNLVPVLLGSGVRFFGDEPGAAVLLDDPEVIQGKRGTNLMYRVTYDEPQSFSPTSLVTTGSPFVGLSSFPSATEDPSPEGGSLEQP